MRLQSGGDLRARLGLGNVDSFVTAADNATEEACTHLEMDLRSPLLLATYSDMFMIDLYEINSLNVKLKLTAGFVDEDTLEIGTGVTMADAKADNSLVEKALVSLESGMVTLVDTALLRYISVRYSAGFALATGLNEDELLALTGVPSWLIKSAELKALSIIGDSPELANKEGKSIDVKAYRKQYEAMMASKIRYLPGSRLPLPR